MKRIAYPFLSLLAIGPVATSCGPSAQQGDNAELATVLYQLSRDSAGVEFKFEADVPVSGPQQLADSVRARLFDGCDSTLSVLQAPPRELMAQLADSFMAGQLSDIAEMKKEFPDAEYAASYSNSLRLHDSQPGYVTYLVAGYEYYPGAAHGNPWQGGYTFERSTGKCLQWDDIFTTEGQKKLEPVLRKAVADQWYCSSQEANEEFLKRGSDGIFTFKLPDCPPLLTAEGVLFLYGAYEIGPYSDGMPKCTLPYSEVLPFLTERAATLVRMK